MIGNGGGGGGGLCGAESVMIRESRCPAVRLGFAAIHGNLSIAKDGDIGMGNLSDQLD